MASDPTILLYDPGAILPPVDGRLDTTELIVIGVWVLVFLAVGISVRLHNKRHANDPKVPDSQIDDSLWW